MARIGGAPKEIATELPLIFPVHRRTRGNLEKFGIDPGPNITRVGPQAYLLSSSPFKGEVRRGMGSEAAEATPIPTPTLPLKGYRMHTSQRHRLPGESRGPEGLRRWTSGRSSARKAKTYRVNRCFAVPVHWIPACAGMTGEMCAYASRKGRGEKLLAAIGTNISKNRLMKPP